MRRLLTSFVLSTFIVGVLVGNAYIVTSIGYPVFLAPIGQFFIYVGFIFAIPPWVGFWILDKLGLAWELRGRESFIESNLALWIYCVVFYTFFIYLIRSLWHRYTLRRKAISNKA
jgi:ribose/xylose/arabinose/galactoside ABC-type transport system permease subunit